MDAKTKLHEFLRGLPREEKLELWDYLDGDPEAIHNLIDCVVVPEESAAYHTINKNEVVD